jgi:L,D-transpeptidase ErfK/SrfK
MRGLRIRVISAPADPPRGSRRPLVWVTALVFLLTAGLALPVVTGAVYRYQPFPSSASVPDPQASGHENEALRRLERSLRLLIPARNYIVVDTSQNQLYVRKGDEVLYQATCSTGSGLLLRDPEDGRQWIFDTPRGYFRVFRKAVNPIWTKPDWAFIEEGKPVPRSLAERRDEDTLGDYALYFGNGYMIHGTLYQRYLGKSITHGCIRLGDEDLERVFHLCPVGTPIYIY